MVSWSWRDVSLIVRLKLDKEKRTIEKSEVKIIDYELKEAKKMKETIDKDGQYLLNYLKWKKQLPLEWFCFGVIHKLPLYTRHKITAFVRCLILI